MAEKQSTLLQTALRVIDGYNKWDVDAVLAPRAPDCTHRVHPLRLDRPLQTNETYKATFNAMRPLFRNFRVTILDTVEDQGNSKVCFHARSHAETDIGTYTNEYMIVLQMTPDHRQLLSFKEFVDSGYSQDFLGRLREHSGKQQREQQQEQACG